MWAVPARLDTPGVGPYKSRPLTVGLLVLVSSVAWAGETVSGAVLPDGATKVAENRYRTVEDYEAIEKFYQKAYPRAAYPRKQIVNQPGIKAVHIVNPSGKQFEGLNIYETNEETRIYIIPSEKPAKPKKPEGKKKS